MDSPWLGGNVSIVRLQVRKTKRFRTEEIPSSGKHKCQALTGEIEELTKNLCRLRGKPNSPVKEEIGKLLLMCLESSRAFAKGPCQTFPARSTFPPFRFFLLLLANEYSNIRHKCLRPRNPASRSFLHV